MSPMTSEERRRMEKIEQFIEKLDLRLDKMEGDQKITKGLLVGMLVAAGLFGYLSMDHLEQIIKMITIK